MLTFLKFEPLRIPTKLGGLQPSRLVCLSNSAHIFPDLIIQQIWKSQS